jgi:plasmid maintenance system antidote protein VapI
VARQVPAKPLAKRHEILATALANGAVTAQRVATLLRVDPAHVYEIAAGRVSLSSTYWRRVLPLLETETR